jgi:signal transduction histidine kinase
LSFCSSVAENAPVASAETREVLRPAGERRDHRGRLLRGYLHKSSNSLCGIKGYASLIAGGTDTAGRATAWARKIIAEVEQLESIYHSVRDMAFPEPSPVHEGGQLAAVVEDAIAAAGARHQNLTVLSEDLPDGRLLLPTGDLMQILGAVLDNSAESTDEPVLATIAALEDPDRLLLSITDDGPGMTHDVLTQAVDPFVTTRDGHLGIGLARVDTILDMHGLGWGLRSAPGLGTTVTLEAAARAAAPCR